jgi:hypothetical protein
MCRNKASIGFAAATAATKVGSCFSVSNSGSISSGTVRASNACAGINHLASL